MQADQGPTYTIGFAVNEKEILKNVNIHNLDRTYRIRDDLKSLLR